MIERINLILRAKNISARQFAEEIGIQPSGMSHILGGRNNPSLDFVQKVIRRYPEIDANWLLLGRGEMYTGSTPAEPQPTQLSLLADSQPATTTPTLPLVEVEAATPPLATQPEVDGTHSVAQLAQEPETPVVAAPSPTLPPPVAPTPAATTRPATASLADEPRRIARVILIYDDGTFGEYRPSAN